MKVSVILPTYNCESTVRKSIESVINQTFTDFELIIVDDSSTDNTPQVLGFFSDIDFIKIYYLSDNSGGPAKPRNFGISKSKYEYIAFIDSDDVWHPNKLEIQSKVMMNHSFNFLSSTRVNFKNDSDLVFFDLLHQFTPHSVDIINVDTWDLLKKNTIVNSSVVVKKELLTNFNEGKNYVALEDFTQWLHISMSESNLFTLRLPLVFYRVHDNSISKNKFYMLVKRFIILYNFRFNGNKRLNVFQLLYLIYMYIFLSLNKTHN